MRPAQIIGIVGNAGGSPPPELVQNGDFSGAAGWSLSGGGGGSAVISGGTLTLSGGSGAFPNASQSGILTSGVLYDVVIVVTTPPSVDGVLSIRIGGATSNGPTSITAAGSYSFSVTANGTDLLLLRNSGFTDTVVIDSISIKAA